MAQKGQRVLILLGAKSTLPLVHTLGFILKIFELSNVLFKLQICFTDLHINLVYNHITCNPML
jgi:hypothetical protein